jgi:transcriptional regulator with XRE-family HTH domain
VQKTYSSEFKKIGKKIKKIRESKKMTQQSLSDACEVDIRTIQRIEKGEMGFGLPILFSIAAAFEMKASDIID